MKLRRRLGYNPKRRVADAASPDENVLNDLACRASYGGNPKNKLYPADYALSPPARPRPGKTLRDGAEPFPKTHAVALLREGLRRGMVSPSSSGEWPQNVWAVSAGKVCYAAQLENRDQGSYHGYPMPQDDDFAETVKREWDRRGSRPEN
jgi:hypothetical protein